MRPLRPHPDAPTRTATARSRQRRGRRDDRGQTTAEYALVILGAAAIAGLLITWAANTGAVERLFDAVIRRLTRQVG